MASVIRSLADHRDAFEAVFLPESKAALRAEVSLATARDRIDELLTDAARSDRDPGALLIRLGEMGFGSDALVMLTLYPLVAVAWADGRVDERERKIVLDAAERAGISRGGLNFRLLESWLLEAPDPGLMDLWKKYARAVAEAMGPDWENQLAGQILSLCERVALATGGFLALDKISSSEYAVLRDLRASLE